MGYGRAVVMKCPRCVQRVHRSAMQCPHCGFSIAKVDEIFGEQELRVSCLTDAAGVLRRKEREGARRLLEGFQRRFPQLFFAVYFGTFREIPSLRQFGFWLLNRGVFEDAAPLRSNEAGILLSVDVSGKAAGITFGYLLEPYLDEEATFRALSAAHPHLLQEQYLRAMETVIRRLQRVLVREARRARRARRRPEGFGPAPAVTSREAGALLERIRAGHGMRGAKL